MKASKPSPVGRATIIGLGGIGRQVALQLAALAVPGLQLVDAGVVTRRAQLREGYAFDDIGRPKVHAAAQACHQLNPKLEIHALRKRSLRGLDLGDVVFLCPGSAAVRRALPRRTDDLSMIVACCTVGSAVIHLALTRNLSSLAIWPGEGADSRNPSPVPIQVTTLAAGLVVAEFIRFIASKRRTRAIRFHLQSLTLEVR